MLIILEGVDGAGKTTLANDLKDEILRRHPGDHVRLWHQGPPRYHPLKEYETSLLDYRPGTNRHIICDRWHLGEVIYPAILGRATQLDEPTLWHLELFLKSRGALLVHVYATLETLRRRLRQNGDDLVDDSHLAPLQLAYDAAIAQSTLALTNHTNPNEILTRAHELDRLHEPLNEFVTYVGPRFPSLLLLGDVRNLNAGLGLPKKTPAFVPYPNTSGHYLLSALLTIVGGKRVQFSSHLGLANACDVDDVYEMWQALRYPTVVPLGVRARRAVDAMIRDHPPLNADVPLGVRHGVVDHPQFVRRFHHAGLREYGHQILGGTTPSWR